MNNNNTLTVEARSPYGNDPIGTRRPMLDFRSETNPDKILAGYQARVGVPVQALLGIPLFGDERDQLIEGKEIVVAFVNAVDGTELSKETWVAVWHEDGNEPDENGRLTHDKVTVVRIA